MRLILVRHGEAEGNAEGIILGQADVPLTDRGREQVRRLGAALAERGLATIFASPLRRAAETAEVVARATGAPVRHLADLRELNCGLAQGLRWDEVEARWPEFARRYTAGDDGIDARWPEGESGSDLRARVGRALGIIVGSRASSGFAVDRPPDGDVAIVAHGGSLAWALQHLLGKPLTTWPRYGLRNCSISELIVRSDVGPADVVRLNDVSHLE